MQFNISNFIDRVFRMEGMNGGYRWRLARVGWLRVYLHHLLPTIGLEICTITRARHFNRSVWQVPEETRGGARIDQAPRVGPFRFTHTPYYDGGPWIVVRPS